MMRLLFILSQRGEDEWDEQVRLYLEQVPDEEIENPPFFSFSAEKEEIGRKAVDAASHQKEIDQMLNNTAKGWTTRRMGKADLAILRLAVYEMLYDDSIPVGVAINEAVDLAKEYGDEGASSFVNGILAKLVPGKTQT